MKQAAISILLCTAIGLLGACAPENTPQAPAFVRPAGPMTWYVRPANDGQGHDFTYGNGQGTSPADAWAGFERINALIPGDTVCLPGQEEPFFERLVTETAGYAGAPVTYLGCGETPALIWSAQGLPGDRSFTRRWAPIQGAAYQWEQIETGLFSKRIDVRPLILWEDAIWLQPVGINTASEAEIQGLLTPGTWGVHDAGDTTFHIYYRATSPGKTPQNTRIRCDLIPLRGSVLLRVEQPYQVLKHMELRGHAAFLSMLIRDTHDIIVHDVTFLRNFRGPATDSVLAPLSNILLQDLKVLYSSGTGLAITPGLHSSNLHVAGGSYSYTEVGYYNGTILQRSADGDGIGIGYTGGHLENILIEDAVFIGNKNYGVFVGTTYPQALMETTLRRVKFIDNLRGCFSEGTEAQDVGTLTISGFVCQGTLALNTHYYDPLASYTVTGIYPPPIVANASTSAMYFGALYKTPYTTRRNVIVEHGLFIGNANLGTLRFTAHASNAFQFRHLVFMDHRGPKVNPLGACNQGDLFSNSPLTALTGPVVIDSIYFYGRANQDQTGFRFAKLDNSNNCNPSATVYHYTLSDDLSRFISQTGATNVLLNVEPPASVMGDL